MQISKIIWMTMPKLQQIYFNYQGPRRSLSIHIVHNNRLYYLATSSTHSSSTICYLVFCFVQVILKQYSYPLHIILQSFNLVSHNKTMANCPNLQFQITFYCVFTTWPILCICPQDLDSENNYITTENKNDHKKENIISGSRKIKWLTFGPIVTLTASASSSTPLRINARASTPNLMSFAA